MDIIIIIMYFSFIAGSTIYVNGNNARPRVIGCSIADSENVGIFVNNGAQVNTIYIPTVYCINPNNHSLPSLN